MGRLERSGTVGAADGPAKMVAAALGVCVGVSGLDHGIFEMLQGNTPTPGLLIRAIGPERLMWVNGTEEAFTIVPNFLVTGFLSFVLGLAMVAWSIRYLDRPHGSRVYLVLGLLLFLVGGGIGMMVFLLSGWAVARRIHRPPALWSTAFPAPVGTGLDRVRPALVVVGLALYGIALQIAITGYVPWTADPETCLTLCWGSMFVMLGLFSLALFGSSAQRRETTKVGV